MAGSQTLTVISLMALMTGASAKVFFQEKFDDSWTDRWTKSSWKQSDSTDGDFTHTAGLWYGDADADKGIQTGPDARFYSTSASAAEKFGNEGTPLVLQFSVKHEQKLDCGGGYIKLLPESSDMADFGGDTPYSIMFGPDLCGYDVSRIHAIFTHNDENLLKDDEIKLDYSDKDEFTHLYTLQLNPDSTYVISFDNKEKASGKIEDGWKFPKKEINDPDTSKPDDWVDVKKIPDPEADKPDGYDDIPSEIPDPEAEQPEDWDEEEDGEWEAPMIDNPEFKGEWKPAMSTTRRTRASGSTRWSPTPSTSRTRTASFRRSRPSASSSGPSTRARSSTTSSSPTTPSTPSRWARRRSPRSRTARRTRRTRTRRRMSRRRTTRTPRRSRTTSSKPIQRSM